MDSKEPDIVRLVHFSPFCCCGYNKPVGKLFCSACWANLSMKLRQDWNDIVVATADQMKKTGESTILMAPAEALTVLKRAIRYLELEMPKVNVHGELEINVRR